MIKIITVYIMSYFYIQVGVKHFTDPEWFLQIMPPYLPYHLELVYLSGVFEIILGIMLIFSYLPDTINKIFTFKLLSNIILFERAKYITGWGLILLLIAVFPANIYLAQTNGAAMDISPAIAWGRLPIQAVFIGVAYWHSKA